MNRLFIFFWFGFAIVVPVSALASEEIKKFLVKAGMPLIPLVLGFQFLFFYILSKTWEPFGIPNDELYDSRITEIREAQHAVIFFFIALYFFLQIRKQNQEAVASEVATE